MHRFKPRRRQPPRRSSNPLLVLFQPSCPLPSLSIFFFLFRDLIPPSVPTYLHISLRPVTDYAAPLPSLLPPFLVSLPCRALSARTLSSHRIQRYLSSRRGAHSPPTLPFSLVSLLQRSPTPPRSPQERTQRERGVVVTSTGALLASGTRLCTRPCSTALRPECAVGRYRSRQRDDQSRASKTSPPLALRLKL